MMREWNRRGTDVCVLNERRNDEGREKKGGKCEKEEGVGGRREDV